MNRYQLIKEIDELLTASDGRVSEKEVCRIFDIDAYEIPWGYDLTWYRSFELDQTYDLIQSKKRTSTGFMIHTKEGN